MHAFTAGVRIRRHRGPAGLRDLNGSVVLEWRERTFPLFTAAQNMSLMQQRYVFRVQKT